MSLFLNCQQQIRTPAKYIAMLITFTQCLLALPSYVFSTHSPYIYTLPCTLLKQLYNSE